MKLDHAIRQAQKNEITEYHIYTRLAKKARKNEKTLDAIARDELRHYEFWKKKSGKDVAPDRFQVLFYYWISRILGIAFGLSLMEKGEERAQKNYQSMLKKVPGAKKIIQDEEKHEKKLLKLIDEERLTYVGSIVLGLNDALVELTGALAGLTLALNDPELVAIAGLVTGIAASFSMAASEYLSTKSEEKEKKPLKASIYTGTAYLLTVFVLIVPYLLLQNIYLSLTWTVINAIIIIFLFTYYISVAKQLSFRKRFLEMAAISLGVALLSFGIGYLVRTFFGLDM